MVLALFFLFTMAVNCFLYIFQGNAAKGDGDARLRGEAAFVLVASAWQAPVLLLVALLFQRAAPQRPEMEDRWVGVPRATVPR